MKRRISIGIICLVMLTLCLFALASCGGSCDHEWGDWDVTLAANCTQDGERVHTCTKCGNTEREIIDATGHAYGAWTTTTPATCTEEGLKTRTCANCSYSEEAATYALGHTFGDWMVQINNTCTASGVKAHYFCSRCNLNYDEDNNLIEDLIIPAAHTFDSTWGYKEADGHAHLCTKCGTKGEVTAHTSSGAATPTTPETCTVCEYVITPANGHVCTPEEEWTYNSTHHWHECVGCEDKQYNYGTHSYDNACDTDCNECGATRAITHTYDNSCDTECNVCHSVREINHTYDNNCDTECNVCHHTRAVNHVFDSECDDECNLCGFTRTVQHVYETITVPADCENQGTTYQACSKCGKVDSSTISYIAKTACTESYSVRRDPTCALEGIGVYTCIKCHKEREVTIAKLPHEYDNVSVTAPTCEAGGYTTHSCECGESYIDEETNALDHNYAELTEECSEPDCENDGKYVEVCSGCGDKNETVLPASGHNMVAPTCTAAGYCAANDGCDKVGEPATSHNYQVKSENLPTCTEDGDVTFECSHCFDSYTETPDTHKATGHNEAAIKWENAEEKVDGTTCEYRIVASGVCPDCSETVTKTGEPFEKHNYTCAITVPDTCVTTGTKTYTCVHGDDSYTSDYEDPDAHTWGEGVTAGGITTYTCVCGETKTEVAAADNEAISSEALNSSEQVKLENATVALDNKVKEQVGDSDVKLSAGILDGTDLESAKAGLTDDQLELLGESKIYNFTMSIGDSETAQFDGFITIRVPYDLGDEDPENITVWYLKDGVPTLVDAKYIIVDGQGYAEFSTNHFSYYTVTKMTPAERCERYGHEFVTKILPATCMEGGYTMDTCRRCGHREYYGETAALGHDYRLNEATHIEASCTADGYAQYSCYRCQVSYSTKTKATGHDWYVASTTAATCEYNGASHNACHNCDASYDTVIPKLAHTNESVVTAPTCAAGGYTTNTCTVCGNVSVTNRTAALKHNFKDEVVAPTCYSDGYTSHVCETCGTARANTDTVPATGHEWNVPAATCTEDMVCVHCNEREAKALGHEYVDGVCTRCDDECLHEDTVYSHDTTPTCDKPGYKVHKCNVCHAFVNTEEIPAVDHEFDLFDEGEATCTTPAYRTEKCSMCGCSNTEYIGEALGHEFENGICGVCGAFCQHEHLELTLEQDADCTKDGFRTEVCTDCGTEITTVTEEALGHSIKNGVCERCGIECAHNEFVYSRDIAPTCTTPGYRVEICTGCSQEIKTETDAPLGHKYVDGRCQRCFEYCEHESVTYSHDVAPTCQNTGVKVYVCDECGTEINGETLPTVDHNYETVAETEATCQAPATKTEKCSWCQAERTFETAPKADHNYENGVCTLCGDKESTESFYQNMLNCWADFKGLAIKLENVSYVMYVPMVNGNGEQTPAIQGSVTMDLAELMLYLDDNGELQGAAYGTATIFNGPVPMEDATFDVKAVIDGGNVYIAVSGESETNPSEEMKVVLSVEAFLNMMKAEMFGSEADETLPTLAAMLNDKLLPLIDAFKTANGEGIDTAMETVLDLLFTKEETASGYVFTLDFDKIEQINANLATLTVSELVDLYVGDGCFDSALALVTEILALELADLPDYLTEMGVPAEDIIALINTYVTLVSGSDFNAEDYIYNPELAGVSLGMLIFGSEDYLVQVQNVEAMLRETSLYAIATEGNAEQMQQMVSQYIAMAKEMISFSFTTDISGVITSVAVDVTVTGMPAGSGYAQDISFTLTVTPDGKFDVTWSDIANEIEDSYDVPETPTEEPKVNFDYYMDQDMVEYEGQYWYSMSLHLNYSYTVYNYLDMFNVMILKDCSDWNSIQYVYTYERYYAEYQIHNLLADPESGEVYKSLLVNVTTGEAVELIMTQSGFDYVRADGTTGSVALSQEDMMNGDMQTVYTGVIVAIFGELEYELSYMDLQSVNFYYNSVTGEFAFESHHNYVLDENASYEPTDCGNDGCKVYVCSECGDTVKQYYNSFEHNYVVDPDQSFTPDGCGQEAYRTYVCTECGNSYRSYFITDHNWVLEYELDGSDNCLGGVYIYERCTMCGERYQRGFAMGHQYESVFTYTDGTVSYTAECAACDKSSATAGNYMKVATDESLEFYGSNGNEVIFAFTPNVSGYYAYYSTSYFGLNDKEDTCDTYGAVYDSNMMTLIANDDRLDYNQFGIEFYFEAGETYYLGSRAYSELRGNAFAIRLEPVTYEYVDLSEYCSCGAELVIEHKFGKAYTKITGNCQWASHAGSNGGMTDGPSYGGNGSVSGPVIDVEKPNYGGSISGPIIDVEKPDYDYNGSSDYCTVCGFAYEYFVRYITDENCNEVRNEGYVFGNMLSDEMLGEYVVSSYTTGNSNHNDTYSEHFNENTEGVDENGNPIHVSTDGYTEYCNVCGNAIRYESYSYIYDVNGRNISYKQEMKEWSAVAGELVLRHTEERAYTYHITDTDGNPVRRTLYDVTTEYNNLGEATYWYRYDYEHINLCHYISTYTNSNGSREVNESIGHSSSEKDLPEESYSYEQIGDDGKVYYVTVEARESYCVYCYASLNKYLTTTTRDANGNTVKRVDETYSVYAENADLSEWRLSNKNTIEYGVYEYAAGSYVSYMLNNENVFYDTYGNEISYLYTRYDYAYGNYCEYDIYHSKMRGEEEFFSGTGSSHIRLENEFRLHDGVDSCDGGLDYYRVCIGCDYEYLLGENWYYSHMADENTAVIVDLEQYGSLCGTVANIRVCVCGERTFVNVYRNDELAFDTSVSYNYEGDEVRFDYHRWTYGCSVTNPEVCGFTYTHEYWYTKDANCKEYYHERYVFGVGTDNPYVVEFSYATDSYRHNTAWRDISSDEYVEGGYTVRQVGEEHICIDCGHVTETDIDTYYRDASGDTVKHIYERIWYYEGEGQIMSSYDYEVYELFSKTNKNGTLSTLVITIDRQTSYNNDGSEGDWYESTYTYTDCIHCYHVYQVYSNGESNSWDVEHDTWDYSTQYYIVEPTCTQGGVEYRECTWCLETIEYDCGSLGHNYWGFGNGTYTCARCGLTNFTGYDGNVVLEDLTDKLGNGEYYVIGYDKWDSDEYLVILTLVVDGIEEPIFLDTYAEDDGYSLVYISLADVKAEVEALGYSLCSEMLRVTFLPMNMEGQIDYSITLDAHFCEEVIESNDCGYTAVVEKCVLCGETCGIKVISGDNTTGLYQYDEGYDGDDGLWHSKSRYACMDDCGFQYTLEQWENYDEEKGYYIVHSIVTVDLDGDGTDEYSWYTTENLIW